MPVTKVAAYCAFDPRKMAARWPPIIPIGIMKAPVLPPKIRPISPARINERKKKKTAGAQGAHRILNGLATVGK